MNSKLTIRDFTDALEIINIFEKYYITDFRDILMTLEVYKFVPQSSIIEVLMENGVCDDPIFTITKEDFIQDIRFHKECNKFNILISRKSNRSLQVYYEVGKKINKDGIELALSKYELSYFALTPYNFTKLVRDDIDWVAYDPMILLKRILIEAVKLKATDLHFCTEHEGLQTCYPVKYRKDGNLVKMDLFTLTEDLNRRIISNLIEDATDSNSLDLITPSGVVAVADDPLGTHNLELRIAANKVKGGFHCVIRLQKKETFEFNIENLGFSEDVQEALYGLVKKRTGIVFITGAIRTGKNTTAFAVLNEIVKEPIKIVSYESPVEVLMPFSQIDYQGDVDMLLHAVRLAKKQDVNVAYLNELPNREVAFAVQDLVNSSIYVLTTMHMDRLWHLPYKLKNYYGEDYKDVLSQISAVFNQKMFGVTCPHCKERVLSDTLKPEICTFLKKNDVPYVSINKGCSFCEGKGLIPGRNQPYVEYLVLTSELKEKMLACDQPFQMELLLKKEIMTNGVALETRMINAIIAEKLSVESLNFIL